MELILLGLFGAISAAGVGFVWKECFGDEDIEEALEMRQHARVVGDFKTADMIRDKLYENGIVIQDTPRGTRWARLR